MFDTHYFDQHVIADPEPRFPTADDIALAERLRRKIEERYLTPEGLGSRSEQSRN